MRKDHCCDSASCNPKQLDHSSLQFELGLMSGMMLKGSWRMVTMMMVMMSSEMLSSVPKSLEPSKLELSMTEQSMTEQSLA